MWWWLMKFDLEHSQCWAFVCRVLVWNVSCRATHTHVRTSTHLCIYCSVTLCKSTIRQIHFTLIYSSVSEPDHRSRLRFLQITKAPDLTFVWRPLTFTLSCAALREREKRNKQINLTPVWGKIMKQSSAVCERESSFAEGRKKKWPVMPLYAL